MTVRGRPILGAFGGLLLGLGLSVVLLTTRVVASDSIVLVVLPLALLVLGIVWGIAAPLGPRTPPAGWRERGSQPQQP